MHGDLMIMKNAAGTTFWGFRQNCQKHFNLSTFNWSGSDPGRREWDYPYSLTVVLLYCRNHWRARAPNSLRLNFNICIIYHKRVSRRASVRYLSVLIVTYKARLWGSDTTYGLTMGDFFNCFRTQYDAACSWLLIIATREESAVMIKRTKRHPPAPASRWLQWSMYLVAPVGSQIKL